MPASPIKKQAPRWPLPLKTQISGLTAGIPVNCCPTALLPPSTGTGAPQHQLSSSRSLRQSVKVKRSLPFPARSLALSANNKLRSLTAGVPVSPFFCWASRSIQTRTGNGNLDVASQLCPQRWDQFPPSIEYYLFTVKDCISFLMS